MRKFSSYGPVDKDLHYYVPRQELIDRACTQLVGENPAKGGHYITVWAPRQAGKTWVMQQALWRLQKDERFDVLKIDLEHLKREKDVDGVVQFIAQEIAEKLGLEHVVVNTLREFQGLFQKSVLAKPLILILDEFDALKPEAISSIASVLRNIYNVRRNEGYTPTGEKSYLLHGVALIGVRAVLGIESQTGSPFNVQRSIHIPNLTFDETQEMYRWYERESGQKVEQTVIDRVFYETQGQPGLVSWFGELLTERFNVAQAAPITLDTFQRVALWATDGLGNVNILNIISKARQPPYKAVVLELFRTTERKSFRYDNPRLNFLYLNGVIDIEETPTRLYVKFPCPFIQKRLFNYFADELFGDTSYPYPLLEPLDDVVTEDGLNIVNLLRRYGVYLRENRDWLLKDVPRRADLRPYEAVYHFSLYRYLASFLQGHGGQVWPEFPTGNGKIDLIIHYAGKVYGIEVKSFSTQYEYREALRQAVRYGERLKLEEITLASFVEYVDETTRARYEATYEDEETGMTVQPVFVETGR